MLFRSVNAIKHSGAERIVVTLEPQDGVVRLSVSDDGCGFDESGVSNRPVGGHWGLLIMRERIEGVGGNFYIDTGPGAGTTVVAEMAVVKN